jgi:hypothetical protein
MITRRAPAVGSASDGEREDGTRLLLLRAGHDEDLYVLNPDGSETRLVRGFAFGASIPSSVTTLGDFPDGSRERGRSLT